MLDRILHHLCAYVRCIDLLDFTTSYESDCIVDFVSAEFFLCTLIHCMYTLISYKSYIAFGKN